MISAVATFQQIAETSQGERGRRAAAGALVLHCVQRAHAGIEGWWFLHARAHVELLALGDSAERSILHRICAVVEEGVRAPACVAELLVIYACELERTRRLPEADAALDMARSLSPEDAEIALHAGRIARKLTDHARALELYRRARSLDGDAGEIGRLASIGEAVISENPERALARVIHAAVRAGDAEAAAVGLEERARLRRAAGRSVAAARDLCIAALRFRDPVDRARVAHALADVALAAGDPLTGREALLLVLTCGDAPQRDHARSRLHSLSRDLGDQLGMRRWRSFQRPTLVSLSAYRRTVQIPSIAPRVVRWREALQSSAAG